MTPDVVVTTGRRASHTRDNESVRVPASLQRLRDFGQVDPDASSEAARVERGLVVAFSVFRLAVSAELLVVVWFIAQSPRSISWTVPALALVMAAFSISYMIAVTRRGDLRSVRWGVADLAAGCASLVVCSLTAPRDLLVGSWYHWAPSYLNPIAGLASAWLLSRRHAIITGAGIGLLYVVLTMPGNTQHVLAVLLNGFSYVLFAVAGAFFATYMRQVARHADENRHAAIEAATALELARYSFHVHNATGLLEAFAKPSLDSSLLPSMQRQAADEANRLRYEVLRGYRPDDTVSGPVPLESVIWDATESFAHLPLEFALALGRSAQLGPPHSRALKMALIALLYNAQLHAKASTITIHADHADGIWEVTVTDDGVGFEPIPDNFGFGLRTQVIESLKRSGLAVSINSHPGEGTCTTISGPAASPSDLASL